MTSTASPATLLVLYLSLLPTRPFARVGTARAPRFRSPSQPEETVMKPTAEDREFYDTLHDLIPSDVPDTAWESDSLSKGAGA